jgi:Concanavalin A-like lectin/glucanases superfamily
MNQFRRSLIRLLLACVLAPWHALAQVNSNHALVLDGVDDYVTVPDTIPLRLSSNDFTFCAWIFLDSYDERNSAIAYKRSGSPVNGYTFSVGGYSTVFSGAPRKFFYQVIGSTGPFVPSNSIIPLKKWTHVAMVHDAQTLEAKIYLDGELDATAQNTLIPSIDNPVPLYFGRDSLGPRYFFHGKIDEVQFWARGLTPHELRAFMRKKLSGREEGLIGYWSFKHGQLEDESDLQQGGVGGTTTGTLTEGPPTIGIVPSVSITTTNCLPTTVLELQFTTDLNSGVWTPVTRDYRTLIDGCRIYSDPVIDSKRMYRLQEIGEDDL